jgi:hypothetical protein
LDLAVAAWSEEHDPQRLRRALVKLLVLLDEVTT